MKKLFLIPVLLFTFSCVSMAQNKEVGTTKIQIGPVVGWATSNPLKDIPGNKGWGFGIGGELTVEHFYKPSVSGIAELGIMSFSGRSSSTGSSTNNKSYKVIPLRAGANLYAGNLHLGALIGIGFNSFDGSKTAFAYSPQIGYNFSRKNTPLDLTVSFDGYAGHGNFSALMFKLSFIL